jgi:hypothetical protein
MSRASIDTGSTSMLSMGSWQSHGCRGCDLLHNCEFLKLNFIEAEGANSTGLSLGGVSTQVDKVVQLHLRESEFCLNGKELAARQDDEL